MIVRFLLWWIRAFVLNLSCNFRMHVLASFP